MGLSDNFILGEYIYKQADLMISESIFFFKSIHEHAEETYTFVSYIAIHNIKSYIKQSNLWHLYWKSNAIDLKYFI